MTILQSLRMCQYLYPLEDRTNRIQRGDSNLEVETARYQKLTNKITRTLRDITTQKGWYSIRTSPFATYNDITPQSKTSRTTSHGWHSIRASPLAYDENKTNNLNINQATNQQIIQEQTHIRGSRSNCHLRSPINQLSQQPSRHFLAPAQVPTNSRSP